MPTGFKELFDACERTTDLLRQLLPTDSPPSAYERFRAAEELIPLLADVGDFADDHDIDDRPLCDVRAYLGDPPTSDRAFADTVRVATARVDQIRTAVHVEGQRRLRAALIGL